MINTFKYRHAILRCQNFHIKSYETHTFMSEFLCVCLHYAGLLEINTKTYQPASHTVMGILIALDNFHRKARNKSVTLRRVTEEQIKCKVKVVHSAER